MGDEEFRRRADQVRARADIVAIIGASVPLSRGRAPRGQCPFHGSKSQSLAIYPDSGRAKCWGCGWSGDAIQFVQDMFGLTFVDALKQLEEQHGLTGLKADPVRREKRPIRPPRGPSDLVTPEAMARLIMRSTVDDVAPVARWFSARGVPDNVLTASRLVDVKFAPMVPIVPWRAEKGPDSVPLAPAIAALVRRPPNFEVVGMHVTFLSPDGVTKLCRRRPDGSDYPARKMLGSVGGGVVLFPCGGCSDPPLAVGEGLETVLSGLAMLELCSFTCGVATLSLDNLQGRPLLGPKGVWRMHALESDPERRGVAWGGLGPVTILVDADMKPLAGPRGRGLPIVDRAGAPIVERPINGLERAQICAELAAQSWRAAGRHRITTVRPPMGQDFNDLGAGRACARSFREALA